MGKSQNQPFQLSFNASLKVDFQGSRVTSDAHRIGVVARFATASLARSRASAISFVPTQESLRTPPALLRISPSQKCVC